MRWILLFVTLLSPSQSYDIAVGSEETFFVVGDQIVIEESVGDVEVVHHEEVAPGAHSITLRCVSSPTGRCTGNIRS